MKKVIIPPSPIKCYNCKCEFTYEAEDVTRTVKMRDGAFLGILPIAHNCRVTRCPVCGSEIILEWLD